MPCDNRDGRHQPGGTADGQRSARRWGGPRKGSLPRVGLGARGRLAASVHSPGLQNHEAISTWGLQPARGGCSVTAAEGTPGGVICVLSPALRRHESSPDARLSGGRRTVLRDLSPWGRSPQVGNSDP